MQEQVYTELTRLKTKTIDLQLSVQRYQGNIDMRSLQLEELVDSSSSLRFLLTRFEQESVSSWMSNLKICPFLSFLQAEAMEHQHHQQAMTQLKLLEEQPLLNQLQVFGQDLQPSATDMPILQLGTLPLNTHSTFEMSSYSLKKKKVKCRVEQ
ncbi:Uncharacterized protein Adt_16357 [Abeliophyllum distichum]|uniref:Uncharacterized protein n=1 Tax=Abeliophyllum distichum TaxID=126358 RepID=A0ABD1TDG8_9LAMI